MHPNLQLWIACNVRACAQLLKPAHHNAGAGVAVHSPHVSTFKPRALIAIDLMLNQAVERKQNRTKVAVKVPQRKNKRIILKGPCHYGCPTTTYKDDKGVSRWQRPPADVCHMYKLDAVVCQRCYTTLSRGNIPSPNNPAVVHGRPPDM